MVPAQPGSWAFAGALVAAKFNVEHIAADEPENPTPYWHLQDIIVSELGLKVARGLAPGLAVEALVPLRVVRSRVHYETLDREPFVPNDPDNHHRNETLVGIADPDIGIHLGHEGATWILSARAAVSIPLGKTEPNPFELGEQGLRHQHIQFGSGTFYPIVGVGMGRALGGYDLQLRGVARLPLSENDHGYQPGERYGAFLSAGRGLSAKWNASTELGFIHEEPETWNGHVEEEGNLGRDDLLLSLSAGRTFESAGTFTFNVQFPLVSESEGDQVEIPLILSLVWEH